jgi:hypothetical protein
MTSYNFRCPHLIVLTGGCIGEWRAIIISVLGRHPKTDGELIQRLVEALQEHIIQFGLALDGVAEYERKVGKYLWVF